MSKFATTEQYNETMAEWGVALVGLSSEQIKRGIDLSISTLSWPPEIAEFIALAKGAGDWRHRGAGYKQFEKALPRPIPDKAVGRAALAGIRGRYER